MKKRVPENFSKRTAPYGEPRPWFGVTGGRETARSFTLAFPPEVFCVPENFAQARA